MGNYMLYMSHASQGLPQVSANPQSSFNATLTDRSELYPTWLMKSE